MLAIDLRDSDILAAPGHRPRGATRVRVALEGAGLRVRQVAPSHGDRRAWNQDVPGYRRRAARAASGWAPLPHPP